MKPDNSLDLISDINTQISKLKKTSQRGGALTQLKNLKDADYKFLNKKETFLLKRELRKIIDNGGNGKNNKLSYNIFNKIPKKQQGGKKQPPKTKKLSTIKKINDVTPSGHLSKELEKIVGNTKKISVKKIRDVTAAGHLSKELEKIVGGSKKYSVNADIQDILGAASYANLIDTEYIDNMVGGGKQRGDTSWITKRKKKNKKKPVETNVDVDKIAAGFERTDEEVRGKASNKRTPLPPKIQETTKSLNSLTEISPMETAVGATEVTVDAIEISPMETAVGATEVTVDAIEISPPLSSLTGMPPIPIAVISDTLPKIPAPIALAADTNPALSTVSTTATARLAKINSHVIKDDQELTSNSSLGGVLSPKALLLQPTPSAPSAPEAETEGDAAAPGGGDGEAAAEPVVAGEEEEAVAAAVEAVAPAEKAVAAAVEAARASEEVVAPAVKAVAAAVEAARASEEAVAPAVEAARAAEEEVTAEDEAVKETVAAAVEAVAAAEETAVAPAVPTVAAGTTVSATEEEDDEAAVGTTVRPELNIGRGDEDEDVEEEVETADGGAVKLSTRTASPPLIEPSSISLDMPATPQRLLSMRSGISALPEHKDSDSFIEELCLKQSALEKTQSDATKRLDTHSYTDALVFNNKLTIFLYSNSMRFLNTIDSKTDIGGDIKNSLKSDYMASMFDLLCILDPDWSEFDVNKFQRESANIEGSELMYYLFKNDELLKPTEEGDGKDTLVNLLNYLTDSNTDRLADNPNKQNIWVGQNKDGSGKILLKNLLNTYPCDKDATVSEE